MKIKKSFLSILAVLLMAACASQSIRSGSVAIKVNETDAHVSLGSRVLQVGDKVDAFRNNCVRDAYHQNRNSSIPICKKEKMGSGTVISLLNERYSVVKFDSGVNFREGTLVEKQ